MHHPPPTHPRRHAAIGHPLQPQQVIDNAQHLSQPFVLYTPSNHTSSAKEALCAEHNTLVLLVEPVSIRRLRHWVSRCWMRPTLRLKARAGHARSSQKLLEDFQQRTEAHGGILHDSRASVCPPQRGSSARERARPQYRARGKTWPCHGHKLVLAIVT